jgi:hypothetical protein
MKLELWVYKLMLQAYPKDFRLEFGHEMLQVFRLELKHAKLERRTLMFWVSVFMDCICGGAREQFSRKGERMGWLQKIAILFNLLFVFWSILSLISLLFNFQSPLSFTFQSPMENIMHMFGFSGIFFIYIGIFLSLPFVKNRMEWFGIIISATVIILGTLNAIFNVVPEVTSDNTLLVNIFGLFYAAGFLLIIFARVKFRNKKIITAEIPIISKFLIVYFLAKFVLPYFNFLLGQYNNSNNIYFLVLTNLLGDSAIAYGIWRSIPTQPNTPTLISSL